MDMDWTVFISPLVSALIAAFGAYQATNKKAEERQHELEISLSKNHLETSTSIAALETKLDLLSTRVEKHNNVVERTMALETDVTNIYHRLDDLKNGA